MAFGSLACTMTVLFYVFTGLGRTVTLAFVCLKNNILFLVILLPLLPPPPQLLLLLLLLKNLRATPC